MQHTLTKVLAISSIASLGLFSATSAQASAFQPAQKFFNPDPLPSTIADGTWSATGIKSIPNPLLSPVDNWTVALDAYPNNEAAVFTVSRAANPFASSPNSFTTAYSITNVKLPIFGAAVAFDLVGFNSDKNGSIFKEIYADADFTTLLGTASATIMNGNATFVDAFFAPQTTVYIKDIISTSGGDLSSYTNLYTAVPEPLTMLGAAAAVGFGGIFKRNAAKKQNSDKA